MGTRNALVVVVAFAIAILLWVAFRPKDAWFPWGSNKLAVMLILGGIAAGAVLGLVVKTLRSR